MSVIFNGTEVTDIVMDEIPLEFLIYNGVFVFGGEYSYLKTGEEINSILSNYFSGNSGVTTIEFVSEPPDASYTKGECLSVDSSPKECYAYVNTQRRSVQIYADDNAFIFFNEDSSYIFQNLKARNTSLYNNSLNIICRNKKVRTDLVKNFSYAFANNSSGGTKTVEFCFSFASVTMTDHMFYHGYYDSIEISPIKNGDLLNAPVLLTADSMFEGAGPDEIVGLSLFNASKLRSANKMFYSSGSKTIDLSSFDAKSVENATDIFKHNKLSVLRMPKASFKNVSASVKKTMFDFEEQEVAGEEILSQTIDISSFDTSNMTDMSYMFANHSKLTTLSQSFDTSNVTDMQYMFNNCELLTNLNLLNFRTSNVTNMQYMFRNCEVLNNLDLSSFRTSNVTNMAGMFYDCRALTSLDLSMFDTSKNTSMYDMFWSCIALTSLDLSNFDTSKVIDMSRAFFSCEALTSLDLSSFDTSNVTKMNYMFSLFRSLSVLDISSFDTSNVTEMDRMFIGGASNVPSSFTTILVSNKFSTSRVTLSENMFMYCTNLVGGQGTVYDSSHVDKEYARIDDPDNRRPGYFTEKTA